VASYSGSDVERPATSSCNGPGSSITVASDGAPVLTAASDPSTVAVGVASQITDFATVTGLGGIVPTGVISFGLFADPSCSGSPVAGIGGTVIIGGDASSGSAQYSGTLTPAGAQQYWWKATYSGDANYPAMTVCGGEGNTIDAS
jgi:hypothetical protein